MKKLPLKSLKVAGKGSWRVKALHPERTKFLAISAPKADAPV